MKTFILVIAVAAGLAGAAAVVVGLIASRDVLVQAGSGVSVAGLVALTATAGLSSWATERRRARDSMREQVYAQLIQQLMSRFSGTYDLAAEPAIRSQVAIWGSPEVVRSVEVWNSFYDHAIASAVNGATVRLSAEQSEGFKEATAKVVVAIRSDLVSTDTVSSELIRGVLFNKQAGS